ncbi:MAG: NAD-binding protein, partial [Rikenellaceae bacterium]|nr:NAD-binding protein [Rikenellaceae bacterium]
MMHSVIVIGGGVAGMEAALTLKNLGIRPLLVEKDDRLGGKINLWDRLFPTRTPAAEVLGPLVEAVKQSGIEVRTGAPVETIDTDGRGVVLSGGQRL